MALSLDQGHFEAWYAFPDIMMGTRVRSKRFGTKEGSGADLRYPQELAASERLSIVASFSFGCMN